MVLMHALLDSSLSKLLSLRTKYLCSLNAPSTSLMYTGCQSHY